MMVAIKLKGGTSKGCFKGLQWPLHPATDLKREILEKRVRP